VCRRRQWQGRSAPGESGSAGQAGPNRSVGVRGKVDDDLHRRGDDDVSCSSIRVRTSTHQLDGQIDQILGSDAVGFVGILERNDTWVQVFTGRGSELADDSRSS
jgi:hypothetical protein